MKDKYIPGQDCGCHAYSESECGCDADWTPTEVYELREQLKSERALADRLAGLLELYFWKYEVRGDIGGISKALAAWKEARDGSR